MIYLYTFGYYTQIQEQSVSVFLKTDWAWPTWAEANKYFEDSGLDPLRNRILIFKKDPPPILYID